MVKRGVKGLLLVLIVGLFACSSQTSEQSTKTRQVEEAYQFTVRTMRTINTNELSALSFREIAELGGDAISWIYANAPLETDWAPIVSPEEKTSWCVVVEQKTTEDWVISGWGDDPSEPLMSIEMKIIPKLPPGR